MCVCVWGREACVCEASCICLFAGWQMCVCVCVDVAARRLQLVYLVFLLQVSDRLHELLLSEESDHSELLSGAEKSVSELRCPPSSMTVISMNFEHLDLGPSWASDYRAHMSMRVVGAGRTPGGGIHVCGPLWGCGGLHHHIKSPPPHCTCTHTCTGLHSSFTPQSPSFSPPALPLHLTILHPTEGHEIHVTLMPTARCVH
jgi:hypothetical protein